MPEPVPSQSSGAWTRREVATLAAALDEFRETGLPELEARVNAVLRGPGERFVLVAQEDMVRIVLRAVLEAKLPDERGDMRDAFTEIDHLIGQNGEVSEDAIYEIVRVLNG